MQTRAALRKMRAAWGRECGRGAGVLCGGTDPRRDGIAARGFSALSLADLRGIYVRVIFHRFGIRMGFGCL